MFADHEAEKQFNGSSMIGRWIRRYDFRHNKLLE